jgi:hypothetical protein
MKLGELFSKLEKSSEFKSFKKENPQAYFCAAFFVFDYEEKTEKKQLDYWIDEGDIETFLIDDKITQQKARMVENEKLKEIKRDEIKVDVDEALKIVTKEAEKQLFKPSKLIIVLQRLKGSEQLIWNITGFSGFNLLRIHLAMDKTFLLNERKSMLEMMKIEKGNKSKDNAKEKQESESKDSANYVG